ncbi:MAG: glycosyltransferase [Akkermansia sp.]|nr:glycosyltransferase [Akkermansia sp.]
MKLLISLTDQSFKATKSVGIFNVSMGLTRGLMQCAGISELHILGNDECADAFADVPEHVHLHLLHKAVPRRFGRIWWDQVALPAAIRKLSPDWALLPKGFPPFLPLIGKTRTACYVHDVIWEYYNQLPAEQNPFPWYENRYFTLLGKKALQSADLVLTSTQFNAGRFRAHVPAARTAVVGIGFDTPPHPAAAGGRKKGVLFHTSTFPHKLTPLGVQRLQAWLAQRADAADIRIHCIGRMPENLAPDTPGWQVHGRVPHDVLQQLMNSDCRTAVYFSAYEGFGMPPVESLRTGLPCVASDIPPIRENIPAQYLFDNDSEQSFIRTMNHAFDCGDAPLCPSYPTWQEVAQKCVHAMQSNI